MARVRALPHRNCLCAASLLLGVVAPVRAYASSFDVFGFGPEGVAEVSARAAQVEDGTASFYNPAGLGFGSGNGLMISGSFATLSMLEAQGQAQKLSDPASFSLALDIDIPLEGELHDRLRLGLGLHALPSHLMRIQTRDAPTPFYPYYDNRTQRLIAIPALGLRLHDSFAVGVGVNALAGVAGPVDVREGQSRALESTVEQEAQTVAAWIFGVRFDPHPRAHLAVTYRQSFAVPLQVTTTANVAGVPLIVDVRSAEAMFDPATAVLAAAVDATDRLRLEVDASYYRWSDWQGPLLLVDTTVSALSLSSHPPQGLFRDSFGVRGAAALDVFSNDHASVTVHGGSGFETSMLRDDVQQGRSNMLDGPKILFGAGASATFPRAVAEELSAAVALQAHQLLGFEQAKIACSHVPCPTDTVVGPDTARPSENIDNPGYPQLSGSGTVLSISASIGVAF